MPPVFFGPERPHKPQVFVGPPAEQGRNPFDFFLQAMTGTNPEDVPTDDVEREEFHEALHHKYIQERTIHAPEISTRLQEILKKTCAPTKWKSLIRRARINGLSSNKFDGKPFEIESTVMGHELRMTENHFLWGCLAVGDDGWLYVYHHITVYPDGKLIGESPTGNGKIDLTDVNRILDAWSKDADGKEENYWDMINDRDV